MNGPDVRSAGWAFRAFVAIVKAIGAVVAMLLVIVAVVIGAIVVWLAYALWSVYLLCRLLAAMFRWIWHDLRGLLRRAPNLRPEQLKGTPHESSAREDRDQ